MEDLMQSQIWDSCRLALPEGLRDLMCDISREVLRAQPSDLYNFIVSYLKAMLLARDTLCVACQLCRDLCQCTCHPELEAELRNLGLDGEDLETAKNVVMEYFDKDEVKEENLLMKLFHKTEIDPNLLPDIQNAVQAAFQKHLRAHQAKLWAEAEKTNESGQKAAKNTSKFHERVQEDKEQTWDKAATTIQAAFRGHTERGPADAGTLKLHKKLAQIESSNMTFVPSIQTQRDESEASTSKPVRNNDTIRLSLSSSSLAGSFINLPKYVPYSVHDMTYVDFEERETERKNIDYTSDAHFKDSKKEEGQKKIGFHDQFVLHEIKSCGIEEEDDIKEQIAEEIQSEATSVEENIEDRNIDNVEEEIENYLDTVDKKAIVEDELDELESQIDVKKNSLTENTIERSPVEMKFVNASNIDNLVEKVLQQKELSDMNQANKETEGTTLDEQKFKQKYPDDDTIDDEVEEDIEVELTGRKISNTIGSKANIAMIKNLKKQFITHVTNLEDDKVEEEKEVHDDSSSD